MGNRLPNGLMMTIPPKGRPPPFFHRCINDKQTKRKENRRKKGYRFLFVFFYGRHRITKAAAAAAAAAEFRFRTGHFRIKDDKYLKKKKEEKKKRAGSGRAAINVRLLSLKLENEE